MTNTDKQAGSYTILTSVFINLIIFAELTDTVKMEAYKIKMDFFQFGTLREICHRLISQYFLLTSEDLSNWDSDPEGFCESYYSTCVLVPCIISTFGRISISYISSYL